jgi:hypothetical protein
MIKKVHKSYDARLWAQDIGDEEIMNGIIAENNWG